MRSTKRRTADRRQHRRAIEEPLRWIATNAGHEGSIVVAKVNDMGREEGFNALNDTYENLVHAGVIDPTRVVRTALQNAASIASREIIGWAVYVRNPERRDGDGVRFMKPLFRERPRERRRRSGAAAARAVGAPGALPHGADPLIRLLSRRHRK